MHPSGDPASIRKDLDMRRARVGIAAYATVLLAAHGALGEHFELKAERISIAAAEALLREWRSGRAGQPTVLPAAPAAATELDSLVFENADLSGNFITPGPGFEMSDDLHMVAGGFMNRFQVAYIEQVPQLVHFLCVFRANTPANTPGAIIAGPYLIPNQIQGVHTLGLTLAVPQRLTTRVWFGMAFSTTSAGPILSGSPTIGTSSNTLYDVDRRRSVTLRSGPASFYLRLWVLQPVAVEETTWSAVKELYTGH